MNAMRFVLPVLVALTMIVGDCSESQARCRIFGRRRARQCCPPPCQPTAYLTTTKTICPLYKTTYDMGNNYFMFYCGEYTGGGNCGTNPQPGYLLENACRCCKDDTACLSDPARCASGAHDCWTVNSFGPKPPNLADQGHSLEHIPMWAGGPHRQARMDVGDGLGVRNISLHGVTVPGFRIFWIGFEIPTVDVPPGLPVIVPRITGPWLDHPKGRMIKMGLAGPSYYVLLKRDP